MQDLTMLRPWIDSSLKNFSDAVEYGFSDIGELLPESLQAYPRAVTLVLRMDDAMMNSIAMGSHAA